MPCLEARIITEQSRRYLHQFCKHAEAIGSPRGDRMRRHGGSPAAHGELRLNVQWSDTDGTAVFDPWGRCLLHATADALLVRIEATNEQALLRIREIVDRDFDRLGRHELMVEWRVLGDTPEDA